MTGVVEDVGNAAGYDWKAAKDAAENLRRVLHGAVHTSPADVGGAVVDGAGNVVHGTLNHLDHLINWINTKV